MKNDSDFIENPRQSRGNVKLQNLSNLRGKFDT
jgi:hypothetical protein